MHAATLRCPGCGAPASADAVRCDYCSSPLATVTCALCFAPMFKGSRFCAKCGAEARRELVEDDKPLPCPRCKATMQGLQLGGVRVSECAECGGVWLAPEQLQTLCNERERHAEVAATLLSHPARRPIAADVVRYAPCPNCTRLMNRTNFAHVSGVIVDVCKHHGIWLDRGELERIIKFVETGGMSRQRQHEIERLAEETRRLKATRAEGITRSHAEYSIQFGSQGPRGQQEESVDGVLAALARLFTT